MALTKVKDDTFIDMDALSLALFADLDSDPKAIIRFTSGQEQKITGVSAAALHSLLNRQSPGNDGNPSPLLVATPPAAVNLVGSHEIHFLSLTRNKAWFYRADVATGRSFFMALVNAKGSCSLRMFDAHNGIALPKQYRTGNYQDQFRELINGATELTVASQPNLERDCKERLPQELLDYLRKQVS